MSLLAALARGATRRTDVGSFRFRPEDGRALENARAGRGRRLMD